MHRTQLMLETWQYEALKTLAEQQGRSLSDVVREALSAFLARRAKSGPSLDDVAGMVREPGVSGADHDLHLYGHGKRK